MEFLADIANGDARSALNAIELGILTTDRSDDGLIHIDLKTAEQCIQKGLSDMIRRVIIIMIPYQHLLKV